MPRVAIRCDASPRIGTGHVARCVALARALRSRGADVEILSRNLPDRVRKLLVAGADVTVRALPAADGAARDADGPALAHASWLDGSQQGDAGQCGRILAEGPRADWLVVDHYALDARWERSMRASVDRILAIDDLADRDHDCDALLDQNLFPDAEARYNDKVPQRARVLCGPKYALLRKEFALARSALSPRDGILRRAFVCFGSFDPAGQTLRALEAIDAAGIQGLAVDVAIGNDHPRRDAIEAFCRSRPGSGLHVDAANVCDLMARADLAIGASGSMNWERAALGLPSIVTSVADNQHAVAQPLATDLGCIYLGAAADWRPETLAGLLRGLNGTPTLMAALSARAGALADGKGAARVAARLLPELIALRLAQPADCEAVLAWRNDEETRRESHDPRSIDAESHRAWFRRVLDDPGKALLIGERGGEPIGVLRYDLQGEGARALVSIYLVPGNGGHGLGSALLRAGSRWLREHRPAVARVRAEIRPGNRRSIGAFADAGFRPDSLNYALELEHV